MVVVMVMVIVVLSGNRKIKSEDDISVLCSREKKVLLFW